MRALIIFQEKYKKFESFEKSFQNRKKVQKKYKKSPKKI